MPRSAPTARSGFAALALAAVTVGLALFTGCGSEPRQEHAASKREAATGGTLRVGLTNWAKHEQKNSVAGSDLFYALDPQGSWYQPAFEIFRCCLLRTLLSYNGRPTDQGGAVLRPDLAAALPTVSPDGLTWTFRLKRGIHYAPPLQGTEIVAQDFIRALEREFQPAPAEWVVHGPAGCDCSYDHHQPGPLGRYEFMYRSLIAGAQEFADRKATNISGLEAPDRHTLVVHLTRPNGDLGYAFSMPAAAPIPPNPADPGARLGVAEGHDGGYGRFLVASGPYMLAGSDQLDFSLPADRQRAVSGYVPGKSFTLVRNPSWDPATDQLRKAYVDRIEFSVVPLDFGEYATLNAESQLAALEKVARKVDDGTLDLFLDTDASDGQLARPAKGRLFAINADLLLYLAMNLALPPFDDVHVRRAVNLVIDKVDLVNSVTTNPLRTTIPEHLAPDSLEGNLLRDHPGTPGHLGDVAAARAEMALSRYDTNRDGICDAPACKDVPTVDSPGYAAADRFLDRDLQKIGISIHLRIIDYPDFYRILNDPRSRIAFDFAGYFFKTFPNASTFFREQLSGTMIKRETTNWSLVGASREQLRRFGYPVTAVPSVDGKIDQCIPLVGEAQTRCWAELDQQLTENVVPWVPYEFFKNTREVSRRVARFSFDQFTSLPALDQIALRGKRG